MDLKVRPEYHRTAERVRAHVLLCMLAYYVEWHMRERLKPLLFDDEDPAAAEAARKSVVAPARVSESAQRKAMSKRNADGLPTQQLVVRLARFAARRSDRDPLNLNPDSSVELGRQMRRESTNSIRASRREVLHQQAGCKLQPANQKRQIGLAIGRRP